MHLHTNGTNNRLVFQINDGYKLELRTLETMELSGSKKKKKINRQNKNWRKCTES